MRSLPLFHRIAGKTVIVLGEGAMAEPKRRLVQRAGGEVVSTLEAGIAQGARLAFIAHDEARQCEADAARARAAGLLVNVVDRPDLCDFTTPSILERDPVLVAVGTSGASAGLAKQLRLRLEALLPADLGALATRLNTMREAIRARWPDAGARRRALDHALIAGGPLDPLRQDSAVRVDEWLAGEAGAGGPGAGDAGPSLNAPIRIELASMDPDELTLRQARLLGSADVLLFDPRLPQAVLARARADAARHALPYSGPLPEGLVIAVHLHPEAATNA